MNDILQWVEILAKGLHEAYFCAETPEEKQRAIEDAYLLTVFIWKDLLKEINNDKI